jgi:putative endonuclease
MVTLTLSLPKGKRNPSMHFQREPRTFYVYIMTDRSQTLYTGVTSKLEVRVWQHKNHLYEGFTSRYGLDRLVYYEAFSRIGDAIAREKQIKGWTRVKKMALIVNMNPTWRDLSEDWGKPVKLTFREPNA